MIRICVGIVIKSEQNVATSIQRGKSVQKKAKANLKRQKRPRSA